MKEFKRVAIQAAKEAGDIILKNYKHIIPSDIKKKDTHDIVTKVDMMADKKIKSIIKKNFPDHDILSEETGLRDNISNTYLWTVDPLDGTTNYSIYNPLHCTAISLSRGNDILISIIYAPFLNEFYYAEKGKGAYLNGKRIRLNKKKKLLDIILLLDKTHNKKSRNTFFKLLNKLQYEVLNVRWFGSASLELAFLSTGRVGACVFAPPQLAKWDLLPGILLVQEAGGQVINFSGETNDYFRGGLIAGNKSISQQIQKKIKRWKL